MSGTDAISLPELLHPSERSRLALAAAASAILFGVIGIVALATVGVAVLLGGLLAIAFLLGTIWLAVQVHRARLLGNAVRVTPDSLPVVHAAFEDACRRLGYERRIDVYVTAKAEPAASFISYLGSRMILVEGSLIASLSEPERRGQLSFLLGRFVGAMKARHMRLQIVQIITTLSSNLVFLNLLLNPYERAVAYSGDQIGLTCCGDLQSALSATNRLLVGGELGPEVATRGVLDQAADARRRWLPRLAQLVAPEPHLTNRYLNLLLFAQHRRPREYAAFVAGLDPATRKRLEALSARSPHRRERRPGPLAPALGATVTAAVLVVTALVAFGGIGGGASTRSLGASAEAAATVTPTATSMPTPTPTPTPTATTALLAHVPAAFRDSCAEAGVSGPLGATASVSCTPGGSDTPDHVLYSQFDAASASAMTEAYEADASNLPKGPCRASGGADDWTSDGEVAGRVACWRAASGEVVVTWTDDELGILSSAWSSDLSMGALHQWWLDEAGPV